MQGREHLRVSLRCSFMEIYNEMITDLLNPSTGNLNAREDINRGCYVENLTEQVVLNGERLVSDGLRSSSPAMWGSAVEPFQSVAARSA